MTRCVISLIGHFLTHKSACRREPRRRFDLKSKDDMIQIRENSIEYSRKNQKKNAAAAGNYLQQIKTETYGQIVLS